MAGGHVGGPPLCWRRGAGAGACSCPVLTGRCPQLLKKMSSSDTPLGTVALLQEKQKAQKTPYIVLSGSGKSMNAYVRVRWRAPRGVGGRPSLQPHACPLSAGTPSPSDAGLPSHPLPNFNIK